MHPILQDLNWRHSCKKYNPGKRVSQADLETILESLRLSASSINSQPWRFILIQSQGARERLAKTFTKRLQGNLPHVHESSEILLFAHNPSYTKENLSEVLDTDIVNKRLKPEDKQARMDFASQFIDLNTDEQGKNEAWTKAQLYLALGNLLHVLARLRINATPMEGVDGDLISREFAKELGGYKCELGLAIGYLDEEKDFNAKLPKSRLSLDRILTRL